MRIVDRKTFLEMPTNTVFTTYEPTIFGPLTIKGESIEGSPFGGYVGDYFETPIMQVKDDKRNGVFAYRILEEAEEDSSYSFDLGLYAEGRDGSFEEDQLYAVFEKKDIEYLISRLQDCIPRTSGFKH